MPDVEPASAAQFIDAFHEGAANASKVNQEHCGRKAFDTSIDRVERLKVTRDARTRDRDARSQRGLLAMLRPRREALRHQVFDLAHTKQAHVGFVLKPR